MCPIIRTVVVLPLVPVTDTTGIRPGAPGGYSRSMIAPAASRDRPALGSRCIRSPGHAFSSITAPGCPASGAAMSASRRSMPHTSSPAAAAARQHMAATDGCTSSVTSVLVPPVDRFAFWRSVTTCPAAGTEPGCRDCPARWVRAWSSSAIRVSGSAWPSPRRGSALACRTRAPMSCRPFPVTDAGRSRAAAIIRPSTTSTR